MHNYKKLDIWIKSISLVKEIYSSTNKFPKSEQFGLTSQMQRAAVSIPANIAEGSAKSSNKDFSRFLEISLGSACELETLVIIAGELNYVENEVFNSMENRIQELLRMIVSFKSQLS
ncbi:MAG: four helix bundle protein [Dysgonamonadaceae bacterium]|jgi:four helix bundle protein|nr:four helix bundle protein [Dysgonamonadaceae bacterium]